MLSICLVSDSGDLDTIFYFVTCQTHQSCPCTNIN